MSNTNSVSASFLLGKPNPCSIPTRGTKVGTIDNAVPDSPEDCSRESWWCRSDFRRKSELTEVQTLRIVSGFHEAQWTGDGAIQPATLVVPPAASIVPINQMLRQVAAALSRGSQAKREITLKASALSMHIIILA
jgi:hypothetical protein